MVSNMLNVPIDWEGSTRSVIIGDEKFSKVTTLDKLPLINLEKGGYDHLRAQQVKINGTEYKGIEFYKHNRNKFTATYAINAEYNNFTTILYNANDLYGATRPSSEIKITIKGDDEVLWEGILIKGSEPQTINIDVTGKLKLSIESDNTTYGNALLGNPTLTKNR